VLVPVSPGVTQLRGREAQTWPWFNAVESQAFAKRLG